MAITTGILATASAIGSTVYSAEQSKKNAKNAAAAQQRAIDTQPSAKTDGFLIAQQAAASAAAQQQRTTAKQGFDSTIRTGPAGLPASASPPAAKTLLGL